MIVKSLSEGKKFRKIKMVEVRASNVVAYKDTTKTLFICNLYYC